MIQNSYLLEGYSQPTTLIIKHQSLAELAVLISERARPSSVVLICDTTIAGLYARTVRQSFEQQGFDFQQVVVQPGEGSKTLQTGEYLYSEMAKASFGRDGMLIALGGGVVGDLTGFVAGTWMRGVRWVNCPTTMEAMVDACLGGKTGVNVGGIKNVVGVFHHPECIVVDPHCLSTLSDRDVCAGLAESIKHAVLESMESVEWHEQHVSQILAKEPAVLHRLIERNLRFKAQIVAEDPEDRLGRRMILNFGHTLGHAIEAASRGELRHGECVALGMVAECRIARRLNLLSEPELNRVRELLELFRLPTSIETNLDDQIVMRALQLDKKSAGGKIRFVLLETIGRPLVRDDVHPEWITEAIQELRNP